MASPVRSTVYACAIVPPHCDGGMCCDAAGSQPPLVNRPHHHHRLSRWAAHHLTDRIVLLVPPTGYHRYTSDLQACGRVAVVLAGMSVHACVRACVCVSKFYTGARCRAGHDVSAVLLGPCRSAGLMAGRPAGCGWAGWLTD